LIDIDFIKCSEGKRETWNERKLPEDESWQEIFRHLKQKDIPLKNTSAVVEFPSSLPGKTCSCGKSVFTGECLME
jgi:hypothetical protein